MEIKLPTIDELRKMGTPEFFGLGFIQLKVDQTYRFHFYHNSLQPIVADDEVHDHRYNFTSYVLAGEFSQNLYNFVPDQNGMFEMIDVDCQTPGVELEGSIVGTLQFINASTYFPGSSYWLNKNIFHTVDARKNAITLLQRDKIEKKYARVVKPLGSETICPFSAPMGESKCWELIQDMMKEIK